MKKTIHKIYFGIIILLVMVLFFVTGCSQKQSSNPIANIDIKGYGNIVAELYPDKAPNTVNNFIELSNKGFYDNLIMHRIVKDFVIQGGDPDGNGTGGPGYSIKGEFSKNNFGKNDISHTKGTLSMARSIDNDSAGSQFFITSGDATYLDGEYAGFGKVVEGMDIVDKINDVLTDMNDKPEIDIVIDSVTIDLNGYKAEKSDKIRG